MQEQWFLDAVNYTKPIDLFVVIGHNPVRTNDTSSTIGTVVNAIRKVHPDVPVQAFGGHSHIRDFAVYDNKATGLESGKPHHYFLLHARWMENWKGTMSASYRILIQYTPCTLGWLLKDFDGFLFFRSSARVLDLLICTAGRYCETLGWLAMSGIESCKVKNPKGVPNPTRKAIPPVTNTTTSGSLPISTGTSNLRYARRYLDWNRLTFAYHAEGSQSYATFDTSKGKTITTEITASREKLNLTSLYGCAPQSYCQTCQPFLSEGNLFKLLQTALSTVVINETRKDTPRLIIINTGSVRFDLAKGPFTYDDSFIVSPFKDAFQFLPDVPYSQASKVLDILNAGPWQRKRDLNTADFDFSPVLADRDICVDPPLLHVEGMHKRSQPKGRVIRRQAADPSPGYTTTDDFGTDGDDTIHARIPRYSQPNDLQANASFPTDGSTPETVDLVFLDFIAKNIVSALNEPDVGGSYSVDDVEYYMDKEFTTNSYLPAYAKIAWQDNVPNCPVGAGIGSSE